MKIDLKTTVIIILFLTIIVAGYYINKQRNTIERERLEVRKQKIKDDKLVKLGPGIYQKLVADTLTKNQLREKIKELGIDLKNAELAQKIVFVPRDTIKIIEQIEVTDTTLTFTDYYPKKENYFARHITRLSTKDTTAIGEFSFNPITLSLAIGQNEDGTYKAITKLPEFFDIKSIDVQSLPRDIPKKDRTGILLGVDYVKPLESNGTHIDFNSYLRIDKFYIGGGFRTDNTAKAGIKIEF